MGFWSDVVDWFTGEAEKPAEPLVLGAELKCPWGTSHSYLYVGSDNIDINNLPQAHVEDCIANHNIYPFGKCRFRLEQPCEMFMWLMNRWENSEPQNVIVNGREIITTKSTLICQTSGTEIRAVTTGQDAIFAKKLIYYKEMNENYPGLLEILLDPHGSLYLDGAMYETAFQFIDDCLARHGGEITIDYMYGTEPEGQMIRVALQRLMPEIYGMPEKNGELVTIKHNNLTADDFYFAKLDCSARAREIRDNPLKRLREMHRNFADELVDGMEQIFCAILLTSAIVVPIEGPPCSLVPQAGIGGAGVPATINPDLNEYYIIGALPGGMQPQLPVLGAGDMGGSNTSWYKPDGSMNYPPNNGAVLGTEVNMILKPGDTLGRYGNIGEKSNFVTQTGADASKLALPPNTDPTIYQEFEVIKEIPETIQSEIAPWGDSPGGGLQYELPKPILQLIKEGYIVPK